MTFMKTLGGAAVAVCMATSVFAETPVLRAAMQESGTVNWELNTIKHNALDAANGFTLEVQGVSGGSAAQVAFQGGAADVIVSDWLWVARQRAAGNDFVFIPYSKAVGAIMVPADSPAQDISDLAGQKIGIAGGPLDKSWLILRAYALQVYGMDLKAETEQVFGAPPLIFKSALSGEMAGAINFWHFLAKMKAAGMKELISVETASQALGLNPDTPLLGYYMKESFVAEHPGIAQALYEASQESKALMASDPAVWEALRPQMNAETDAQFEALKADYLAGSPARGPVDLNGADKFLKLMAELGGEELVGQATTLPDGLFADVK